MKAITELAAWLVQHCTVGKRHIVALAGAPGSGKSTIAAQLVRLLNVVSHEPRAVVVPMDGFHLSNEVLIERGRLVRKGAPDTFDVQSLKTLLDSLTHACSAVSYPLFDRANERTIPNAGVVTETEDIVVLEGNYLLLNSPPWHYLRPYFSATVMLRVDKAILEERLIQRWLGYGLSYKAAKAKVLENDLLNAQTVMTQSAVADRVLSLN